MVSSVGDAIDLVEELRRSVALADGLRIRGVQQVQVALSLHEQPRPKGLLERVDGSRLRLTAVFRVRPFGEGLRSNRRSQELLRKPTGGRGADRNLVASCWAANRSSLKGQT